MNPYLAGWRLGFLRTIRSPGDMSVRIGFFAIILVVNVDFLERWFGVVPLTPGQWGGCILGASAVLIVMELGKIVKRRRGLVPA